MTLEVVGREIMQSAFLSVAAAAKEAAAAKSAAAAEASNGMLDTVFPKSNRYLTMNMSHDE